MFVFQFLYLIDDTYWIEFSGDGRFAPRHSELQVCVRVFANDFLQ
jgi:hypothetical protein